MASQLRLHVLLPVVVLGALGLGVGAFAFGKPAQGADPDAIAANIANRPAATTAPSAKNKNEDPPRQLLSPLERQLERHRVVVVLFYAPGDDYDTIQTREARAGALAANAGFLAVDVSNEKRLTKLATEYDVLAAPAVLVFARGPRVAVRIQGYADRAMVAQAAHNARS
jgi:thiol:disulfide interchange protein